MPRDRHPTGAAPSPADDEAGAGTMVEIDAPRQVVFDHLVDPTTYPDWLVGAKKIRGVDDHWPEPGAAFRHRIGFGPLTIDDATTVVTCDPPGELVLRASMGPFGQALVTFRLVGSRPTQVHFDEAPESGPVRALGHTVGRLVLKASVWGRNRASLANLERLIEDPST